MYIGQTKLKVLVGNSWSGDENTEGRQSWRLTDLSIVGRRWQWKLQNCWGESRANREMKNEGGRFTVLLHNLALKSSKTSAINSNRVTHRFKSPFILVRFPPLTYDTEMGFSHVLKNTSLAFFLLTRLVLSWNISTYSLSNPQHVLFTYRTGCPKCFARETAILPLFQLFNGSSHLIRLLF